MSFFVKTPVLSKTEVGMAFGVDPPIDLGTSRGFNAPKP